MRENLQMHLFLTIIERYRNHHEQLINEEHFDLKLNIKIINLKF